MGTEPPVLETRGLSVEFVSRSGVLRVVDDISLQIKKRETLAIVGESGCGKSVTSLAIMRLLPETSTRISGNVLLCKREGRPRDLLLMKQKAMRHIRGADIAMIFQEPMTSLNPIRTVGHQISEAVRLHTSHSRMESYRIAEEMLKRVGIPEPHKRMKSYPYEMSGGMRQRVMIAMALCCNPQLLIADEPSTALDVTIQAQILNLMKELQNNIEMALLFITHDISVVARIADRVMVMYAGRIVEEGDVVSVLKRPRHPYTRGLLASNIVTPVGGKRRESLNVIPGTVPSLDNLPSGCRFHPRCIHFRSGLCDKTEPDLKHFGDSQSSRCHFSVDNLNHKAADPIETPAVTSARSFN